MDPYIPDNPSDPLEDDVEIDLETVYQINRHPNPSQQFGFSIFRGGAPGLKSCGTEVPRYPPRARSQDRAK